MIRALCAGLALFVAAASVQAKPSVVTASQDEIRRHWMTYSIQQRDLRPGMEFPHQACFEASAARHDMPLSLLLAVARGESNFDRMAISKADAVGVMQILWPGTARHLGITRKADLFDPCTNIDAGTRYLKEMLARYDGDVHLALAAYNYGPGRIDPKATRIQDGAAWYSGYIHNHLVYVLGRSAPAAERTPPRRYENEQRLTLVTFWDPQRAARFVAYLRELVPSVRLDWFDLGLGRYTVDLLYQDSAEAEAGRRRLAANGFTVPQG